MGIEKNFVTYEEFGAKGDGKTNDFEALMLAHEYANENHLPVKADGTKTYYLSETEKDGIGRSIVIKTDTDFGGAHFLIDDTDLVVEKGTRRSFSMPIISILPYEEKVMIDDEIVKKIGSLKKTDTKIDVGLGYPAMLILYNENHKVYIRYGGDANNGAPQHELVLIDAEGNVDPTTPIMFDYPELTKIVAIRTDIPTIVVENGIFTHRVNRTQVIERNEDGSVKKKNIIYIYRGMVIARSNTIVRGIENYMDGEITVEEQAKGLAGPSYHGFFDAHNASNITIENCVLSAKRYFGVAGTYGFGAQLTNNIVLKNCRQSNFYLKDERGNDTTVTSMEVSPITKTRIYWGLGGSNFCKNMVYDSCEITRFDAHDGLYNGKIINSKVVGVNLTGFGDMLIENSTLELVGNSVLYLRTDYGSTWEGTVTIKDTRIFLNESVRKKKELFICDMQWVNHYFGYECHFPNILLDGVNFDTSLPIHLLPYENENCYTNELIGEKTLKDGVTENDNPYVAPSFIKCINNVSNSKIDVEKSPFFANTEFVGFEIKE